MRIYILSAIVFTFLSSFSQEIKTDSFNYDGIMIYGEGELLEENKFGFWNYYYKNGNLAYRLFYLIDTNYVRLSDSAVNIMKKKIESVMMDSLIISYDYTELGTENSGFFIGLSQFQPFIAYDTTGNMIIKVIEYNNDYFLVDLYENKNIHIITQLKNGKEEGYRVRFSENNKILNQSFFSNGKILFSIKYTYDELGNLTSAKAEKYEGLFYDFENNVLEGKNSTIEIFNLKSE